ncbi:MAG: ATP-binding protein, partial [Psychromonas sp.]
NPHSNALVNVLITDTGSDLVIEVTDIGPGISPVHIQESWKTGVTIKHDCDSHGIGLYLVNRYVTDANGFISVDNADPHGCIFSVFIPNKC